MAWGTPTAIATAENSAGATLAVTVPVGGVPTGALIVVLVGEKSNTIGGSVADTAGNTYTAVGGILEGFSGCFGRFFYAYNATALVSTNIITYTKQTSGTRTAMSACYVTGELTSSDPYNSAAAATNSGISTSPTVTSGTPSVAGEMLFALCIDAGSTADTITNDGTWSNTPPTTIKNTGGGTNDPLLFGGWVTEAGTSTHTFAPTITSRGWGTSVIGFKVVPAASTKIGAQITQIGLSGIQRYGAGLN